ncbi:SDR family NAD(P)-dependent oxidoreductase [Ammoniphilus resinae]|uniref:3-oxoacyl-[acyl-carrier protein] reductase n=1 Tax=Ammoniphilus resinae TaxID=861532 RepID=A0ABS4GQ20_9BACL|nr:3-oxoacyl-[acyl-carrier protein] reductase [Ammoniphilus resinae]
MRLQDKVAVVTGGGGGIGWSTGLLFLQKGAKVILADIEPPNPEVERALLSQEGITFITADVSQEEGAKEVIDTAVRKYGGIDILMNNAGINPGGTVTDTPVDLYDQILSVNLKSAFLCSKFAVPHMLEKGRGSIVNVSSINGIRGNTNLVAYSASKSGIIGLTQSMALDYAEKGIRVNCICPGTIKTRMVDNLIDTTGPEIIEALLAKSPMRRFGEAAEIAYAALFLASDEASFITGVTLPVDGGRSIR